MTGLFLIIFGLLTVLFTALAIKSSYFDEWQGFLAVICGIAFIILLAAIPISRMNSKTNVEKCKQFQIVVTDSRNRDTSEMERLKLIETIDSYNSTIAEWKTKSQHWYNNKWYYVPECKNVDYIK
jgi:hypothetical protein